MDMAVLKQMGQGFAGCTYDASSWDYRCESTGEGAGVYRAPS